VFVGREKELSILSMRWKSEKFECVIIYGRRRVGKTALINEFCKNKPHIFFTGLESTVKENLQNFSQNIFEATGRTANAPIYTDFNAALLDVAQIANNKRLALVIDEFPYLAASYNGISSLLQKTIDHKYKNTKIFLILCGSSMSFMENQVLGAKSPLFGRRTSQIKLLPLNFFETVYFHPKYSLEELAILYGIAGGIPHYQLQFSEDLSLSDNIKQNLLEPSAYLFEEPINFLKQEVREPSNYNAIVQAIATGSSKLNEIATKTGLESSAAVGYLKNLISLSIVKKETPLGAKNSRHSIYKITDPLFRFWYRFIPRNYSQLQNGMIDAVYKKIEPHFSEYMGRVFEDICLEWLWEENAKEKLPFIFTEAGRWWGNDKIKKSQVEIDIIAKNEQNLIFCECKWKNEPIKVDILKILKEKSNIFECSSKYWYIFSKSGFSKECEKSTDETVRLISFKDMYNLYV